MVTAARGTYAGGAITESAGINHSTRTSRLKSLKTQPVCTAHWVPHPIFTEKEHRSPLCDLLRETSNVVTV